MPVVVHRQVQFYGCQGRHHCRGAEAISVGEIPQLQSTDKVFDVSVVQVQQVPRVQAVRIPQLQPVDGHCRSHARRCAATDAGWFRRQKTVKVPKLQYI